MSEETSSEDATGKVNALEQEYAAFRSAMTRTKNIRMAILLGAIALVAVIGYMFYSLGSNLLSEDYQAKILKVAQERLEKKKDDYMKEVQTLVDTAAPQLKDAFYKQTQKDMPKYQAAFGKERDTFKTSITEQLRKQVNEQYRGALAKYQDRLAKEFPELENPELKKQAFEAIGTAYDNLVKTYYADKIAGGIQDIYDTWDAFPKSGKTGDNPEEVLIGLLLQLVSKKMAN